MSPACIIIPLVAVAIIAVVIIGVVLEGRAAKARNRRDQAEMLALIRKAGQP